MSTGAKRADLSVMRPCGPIDRIRLSQLGEEAQTMAEYAVVLAVITPIVILAFAGLSGAVLSAIDNARSFL
jgi:Flp pilus assembly pilin Flp